MFRIRVVLSKSQRASIETLMRTTSNKYEALRSRIVLLLAQGLSPSAVAECAGCARATVYRTVYRFEDEGEEGLLDGRKRRSALKASPEAVVQLLRYLDGVPKDYGWQRSVWTLEVLARQLKTDTGVTLSPTHLWRLLRQEGCRRGRPRPALRIPVRGRRTVLDAIETLVASASVEEEVFYADEADIDLNPRIGLTYIKRGHQPLVFTPGKNVKYYIAGALNARTGRVLYRHGPKKNSVLFIDLLEALCCAYRRARKIHVVLDNYIIHKSQATLQAVDAMHGKIQLHFLPPYSPDHNRIERLWKQLHDNVTRNHRHPTMPSLWEDVTQFLEHVQSFPGTPVSNLRIAA
jgi:transposase